MTRFCTQGPQALNDPLDIICFSREDWLQRPWMNRQQLISQLTKWYRIVYVTRPFHIRTILGDAGKGRLPRGSAERLAENLIRYAPPKYLPFNYRVPKLEEKLSGLRLAHLRMVCRQLNFRHPILLLWDPDFQNMIGHFNESLVCYFADDQYSLFSGATSRAADEEKSLLRSADLIMCTAETLCEDKQRHNANVYHVGNGVDYSLFASATVSEVPIPQDIRDIRRPILGFVGSLNDKVDYELLTAVASDNPGWSIVLIGADNVYTQAYREQFRKLVSSENVKWLGFRPLGELPGYLKGMDVCAIPNKVNEYTRFVYPIKLHEYLAAGKPIISTDNPTVRLFNGLVRVAESASEWRRHLQEAMGETGPRWIARRQEIARQNTWEARAQQVHALLGDALKKKEGNK